MLEPYAGARNREKNILNLYFLRKKLEMGGGSISKTRVSIRYSYARNIIFDGAYLGIITSKSLVLVEKLLYNSPLLRHFLLSVCLSVL